MRLPWLRYIFFQWIVRPIIHIFLGLHIRHPQRLPQHGPAILIANHNSHLDTMVLMSLFPWRLQKHIAPIAAADYFLHTRWLAWFAQSIIGIIPLHRKMGQSTKHGLFQIQKALDARKILIFYPEGSRGQPELMSELKRGIAYLVKQRPAVPVYPIFLYGLGKALPKNEALLVPFGIDVVIGEPLFWQGDTDTFMTQIKTSFAQLQQELPTSHF